MAQADQQLDPEALQALVTEPRWPLAAWYARPLSDAQAQTLSALAARSQQQAMAAHQSPLLAQRLAWIAAFWIKGEAQMQYESLLATAATAHDRALTELIQGQLLCSVRRLGAHQALTHGFQLAADLLASEEYFILMKRHELLACLTLSESGGSPATLPDLLLEAQVIKRLQKGHDKGLKSSGSRSDTLG